MEEEDNHKNLKPSPRHISVMASVLLCRYLDCFWEQAHFSIVGGLKDTSSSKALAYLSKGFHKPFLHSRSQENSNALKAKSEEGLSRSH